MHHAVAGRRPGEMPFVQPLRHQNHAAAVPRQELHSVGTYGADNKHVTTIGALAQRFAHQCRQRVHRLAKVYRLGRQHHLEVGPQRYHRAPLSTDSTVQSIAASTSPSTRMRAPLTWISTTPQALVGGAVIFNGLACAAAETWLLSAPIWIGKKLGALPAIGVIWRRQTVSSPRETPLRRATSEMFVPSSKLSATIRAFSSPVHRRRRRSPVISSTRRYPPSSCLASSMAFAIAHLQRSAYARLYRRRFTRGLGAALTPVTMHQTAA